LNVVSGRDLLLDGLSLNVDDGNDDNQGNTTDHTSDNSTNRLSTFFITRGTGIATIRASSADTGRILVRASITIADGNDIRSVSNNISAINVQSTRSRGGIEFCSEASRVVNNVKSINFEQSDD